MKIVFDQGTPAPLRGFLIGHQVETLAELGWSQLSNGELLSQAESLKYRLPAKSRNEPQRQKDTKYQQFEAFVCWY